MDWQRLNELFHLALSLPAADRTAYLIDACAGDSQLFESVQSCLEIEHNLALDRHLRAPQTGIIPSLPCLVADHGGAVNGIVKFVYTDIGPYRIETLLGQGGTGWVFLGRHRVNGQAVAIKVLRQDRDITELAHRRFDLERQLLSELRHENIARLIDFGTTSDGVCYFAVEYVNGLPITDYVRQHDLGIAQRVGLFKSLCHAVAYAHEYGILHRDIKPQNVLVTADGIPKLIDFGIAKVLEHFPLRLHDRATTQGESPMTPEYASPEQLNGERAGVTSDTVRSMVDRRRHCTGHGGLSATWPSLQRIRFHRRLRVRQSNLATCSSASAS